MSTININVIFKTGQLFSHKVIAGNADNDE